MHKRTLWWIGLLLVILAGALLPSCARAETSVWVLVGGIRLDKETPYLEEYGTVASAEKPAGDYVHFSDGVLTLAGFSMEYASTESAVIAASGDLRIVFSGENEITFTPGNVQHPAAIKVDNGTLTLCGQDASAELSVTVVSSYQNALTSSGIDAEGVTVEGQGKVTATGGGASEASYGIHSGSGLSVRESAQVIAVGGEVKGDSEARSVGVQVTGVLSVESAGASLTATGGSTVELKSMEHPGSYGIYVRNHSGANDGGMLLTAGSVTAKGGGSAGESYGMYGYTYPGNGQEFPVCIRVSGGELLAEGGQARQHRSVGIALGSDAEIGASLTVTGGEVVATGGKAMHTRMYGSYGFFAHEESALTISGGTVTFSCGSKGRVRSASELAPDLNLYPSPKVTASENRDGSSPVEAYNAEDYKLYKYLRIEPDESAITITVQASPAEGGSATLSGEQAAGSEVTATAEANTGYVFTGWYEGDELVSSEAAYTFTVSGSRNLTAKFSKNTYTVSVDAGTGGAVSGAGEFAQGEEVALTATPTSGYTFAGWYEGDNLVESEAAYTFTMPEKNVTLTAKWTPVTYTISYKLAGGSVSVSNPNTYTIESEAITLINPTRTGYVFSGWTGTGLTSAAQTVTIPAGSTGERSYTATWLPASDTAYGVEHHFQNIDGDAYVKDEAATQHLTGTTGEQTDAKALARKGFTAQPVTQKTIAADGTTIVQVYYDRNEYTLTFDLDNGEEKIVQRVKYEATITVPTTPTKPGYEFAGWTPAVEATMPASDATYTAQWTASSDTAYTVEHHFQNVEGNAYVKDEAATQHLTGTTGEQTNATALSCEGFTAQTVIQKAIAADGTTIVQVYYDRNAYTLTFELNNGEEDIVDEVKYEATITAPTTPTKPGYDFAGWTPSIHATMPASDVTYTAQWAASSDTSYTVEHHFQNIDGDAYVKDEAATQHLTGTTGEQTNATVLSREGFTVQPVTQKTIAADGTTVVEIYYDRNAYTLTFELNNGEEAIVTRVKYEVAITAPTAPTKSGYNFAGWTPDVVETMPASDTTYTAQWTASSATVYTVEHHFQNIDGNAYVKDEVATQHLTGTTGEQTDAKALARAGFTAQTVTQETIAADGTTVVAIYYDRNAYTLTFELNNGEEDIVTEVKYEAAITAPTAPTKLGYDFTGWTPDVAEKMPALDVTYTAQWTVRGDTSYTVEHHFQNIDGDAYVKDEAAAQHLTGTTGELTDAKALARAGFTAQTVTQETIAADGTTVVAIYYDRNAYTLTFDLDNSEENIVQRVKYEATITAPTTPTKPGYDFAGWIPDVVETMPASDTTYTAQWTASSATAYTVEHHFQNIDGNAYVKDEAATQHLTGTTGEQTNATALSCEGFTAQTVIQKAIAADGTTIVQVYYDRNVYTLTFNLSNGEEAIIRQVKYGAAITAPAAPTKSGYDFSGWTPDVVETMPASDTTYTAQWTASSATVYTVEHHFQNIDGDAYVKDEAATQHPTGTTGAQTDAKALAREGFTAQIVTQETIAADGTTVVAIYYDRNAYTLTFNLNNGEEAIIRQVKYEATITAPAAPTKPGYDFAGWHPAIPATMPATNATYTAQWTPKELITTHTIRFVANGGSGSMPPISRPAGSFDLPACGFSAPAGKQFKGWALRSEGAILTSPLVLNADVVLYAIWGDIPAAPQLPVIIAPQDDQLVEVYEEQSAELTVIAKYADAYQWYVDRNDGQGFVPIPGAQSAVFTTEPVDFGDDGWRYFCIVSNESGAVKSPVFELLVLQVIVPPYTGDPFDLRLWAMLALVSFAGICLVKKAGCKV